jgi:hypothetical protein
MYRASYGNYYVGKGIHLVHVKLVLQTNESCLLCAWLWNLLHRGAKAYENRILRKIFRPEEVTEIWRNCKISALVGISRQLLSSGQSHQGKWDGRKIWHAWKTREMHVRFERGRWRKISLGADERIKSKWVMGKRKGWCRLESSGPDWESDGLLNALINLCVPQNVRNFLTDEVIL